MARFVIKPGAKVKLLRDVSTRGNRKFHAGVVMTVVNDERCYFLKVTVRARTHYLQIQKKEAHYLLAVVEPAPRTEDDNGNHAPEGSG